jgi:adenylate cyclase
MSARPQDRYCSSCGATIADASPSLQVSEDTPAALGEQRKVVTVLFADLSGSTPLGERLDPEQLRGVYERYFSALSRQVRRYEGTIDKYVGDAIMAVFGAPMSHEDDAERAIRAGLAMQGAIAELNDDVEREHGVRLALRVGINTGEVVAGLLASDAQHAYTVVGDTVNTAHRFEAIAPTGEVVVSEATRQLAIHHFEFEALPAVALKGKRDDVVPYRVVRAREDEVFPGVGTLVGRASEMEELRAALGDALEGRGCALALVGEAGVGKSRLVLEFRRELAAGLPRLVGRCASYAQNTPYALLAELLRGTFAIGASDPEPAARGRVLEGMSRFGIEASDAVTTLLLDLLGFGERSSIGPELKRQIVVSTTRELLARATAELPLVIVVEDMQWIDSASASVLTDVVDGLPTLACLLIITSRPGGAPSWATRSIALRPLGEDDATALIAELATDALSADLQTRVRERTAGNPFFIEEVVRHARASGVGDIPATIQEAVEARLDHLADAPREVLDTGAIVGRSFWYRLIHRVLPRLPLAEHLDTLERESFIARRATRPELTYAFRQPLIQEVAYRMQLASTRRVMHGRVGAAIEALYEQRLDEFTDTLAYHYGRSDDGAKARTWLVRAGDRARTLFANDEALTAYRAALDRTTDDNTATAILEHIGDIETLVGQYDEALATYARARERVGIGDPALDARLLRKTGAAYRWKGDYASALRTLDDARARLGSADDAEAARIALQLGMAEFHRGDYPAARAPLMQGVELGRRVGADDVLAEGLKLLGNVANNLGALREAVEQYNLSLEIFERLDDKAGIADLRSNLGNMYRRMGRFDAALSEHRASLALRQRIGHRWGVGTSHNNIGEVLRSMGRPAEAVPSLERALETWDAIGASAAAGLARMNLGSARVEAGDIVRGRADLREALGRLQGTKFLPSAHRDLALAELAAGDADAAAGHAEQALALARAANARQTEAQVERVLGQIALARGERERARELLETSRRTFNELGEQTELARTDAVLARVNGP